MINLAVIEIKDVIKYLVRLTIIITIVLTLTRYFLEFRTNLENSAEKVKQESFLACLDTVIPSIKNVNNKQEENIDKNFSSPLKMALEVELGMINSIKNKEENQDNKEEEKNQTDEETKELKEAETGLITEVQENNVPEKFNSSYKTVKIKNETKIKLTTEILTPNVKINTKDILIYHTHSCESYTPTEKYSYEKSGNFRTLDKERSVIRVGSELTKYMQNYGYNVIHNTTLHDYPSYNSSYSRSYKSVSEILDKNQNLEVLFDLHRDAIGDSSYAPTVKIGEEYAAQLMFVIGSNGGGAQHDNWQQNLKFAVKIQEKANELYPGLFKPIILRNSRYNQQLANGASIIEVGATGNTLEQCLVSMKYLARVLKEIE